ncbi:MAG: hypothetical protein AAFY49_13175, partial [Pseudomonadota bacterium]
MRRPLQKRFARQAQRALCLAVVALGLALPGVPIAQQAKRAEFTLDQVRILAQQALTHKDP